MKLCHFPGSRILRDTDPQYSSRVSLLAPKAMHCNDSQRQKITPTGWAAVLGATLKKDQRLSAPDIGGGDRGTEKGTSPRGRLLDFFFFKNLRPGDVFPSFSPAHELFLSRQECGHLVGAFQEPRPTTPHSGKALSSHLNPTCDGGWGWPRSNPDLARQGSEISQS